MPGKRAERRSKIFSARLPLFARTKPMAAPLRQVLQPLEQEHRPGPSGPGLAASRSKQMSSRPHATYQPFKGRGAVRSQREPIEDTLDLGINSYRGRLISVSVRTLIWFMGKGVCLNAHRILLRTGP